MKVAVIGAGIWGACSAYHLKKEVQTLNYMICGVQEMQDQDLVVLQELSD